MTGNIADFLLARIAEDEAEASVGGVPLYRTETRGVRDVRVPAGYSLDAEAQRAVAECAAKRRIVELRRRLERPRGGLLGPNKADAAIAETLVQVFKLMAVPYAGHPDYDPEWRV